MSGARQNTLVVDFSVLPVRPEVSKVHHFLENELKLQYADIKSIQLHHSRNCVLIEMRSKEIVARYQLEHNWKRTMLCNNAKFRIPVYVDCEAVTVRVHDLPPSMSHVTIADHMLKYGEVISIRNEKWKHYFPGISNGVRVLRMNLLRPIPSFITIDNEETMVSYNEQPKSCRLCTQPYHPGNKCPERSTTPAAENPPTSITSKSSDGLFTPDDFPPITNDRQKTPSPVLANETTEEGTNPAKQQSDNDDDDWTDDNDASNSSTEHNRTTHKRRRSRRDNKDRTKKACADQCSPNTDHEDQLIIR